MAWVLAWGQAPAEDGPLGRALTSGDAQLALRFRYEHVDQDGFARDANAAPLRIRIGYQTGDWSNWSAFVEFDHIVEILLNDYNTGSGTSPGRTRYPLVADPKGSDLNQLYLQYDPAPELRLRIGRQRITLDDHRFVGNVVWRQNEQTYDALGLTVKKFANAELFYGYIENVNRIFGDSVPSGDHSVDAHLLNARVVLSDAWSVTPYVYYIDSEDDPSSSTSTIGARLAGKLGLGRGSVEFLAELARQSDAADNPVGYDADFAHLRLQWVGSNRLTVAADFESLGGHPTAAGAAFRTPFATGHAFQGWADQFLATPDSGIEDAYLSASYDVQAWTLRAVYHDFSSEAARASFGTELDVSAERKLGDRYALLLKAALFDADPAAVSYADTNKFWVMLSANY